MIAVFCKNIAILDYEAIKDYENSRKKQINKISFVYCEYDENKKLIEKPLKNGSLIRTVNPVRIMWSNGYYYLVTAIHHKHNNHGDNDFIYIMLVSI